MRYIRLLICGVLILTISGCALVLSKRPVGSKPASIKAEAWEGTWINSDGALVIKVVDSEKGFLRFASIKKSNDTLKLEEIDVFLRGSGDWIFWNMKDKDTPEKSQYLWGRIINKGKHIILWLPDFEKFKALVEEGKFPGEIQHDNIMLGDLEPKHYEMITSESIGVPFHWDDPMMLTKITK